MMMMLCVNPSLKRSTNLKIDRRDLQKDKRSKRKTQAASSTFTHVRHMMSYDVGTNNNWMFVMNNNNKKKKNNNEVFIAHIALILVIMTTQPKIKSTILSSSVNIKLQFCLTFGTIHLIIKRIIHSRFPATG